MHFLENLRKKSGPAKSRIALSGALFITAIFALVWVTTLPARMGEVGNVIAGSGAEQTAAVQDSFTDFFDKASEGLDEAIPPVEDAQQLQAPSGALNDLSGWSTDGEESRGTLLTPEEQAALDAITFPEPATVATSTPSEPKIILIGTTTKKTE